MLSFIKKSTVVIAVTLLLYVSLFYGLYVFLGAGMTLAVMVPVLAIAWYHGRFWGVTAALLSIFTNIVLSMVFGLDWRHYVLGQGTEFGGTAFVGMGALVLLAWMIGYLHTLRLRNQSTVLELKREIDERRNAEAEQQQVMQFSEKVIESSIDSITVGDERGNIIMINAAALALSGYSREEIIGKSHAVLTHIQPGVYQSITGETITVDEAYQASTLALQTQLYETGRIEGWEYYLARKDGQLIPVEGNIVMLRNGDGDIAGSLAIVRDISGRRVIERELAQHRDRLHDLVQAKTAQLQAREQEFRRLVETMNEGLLVRDAQGNFTYVNDRLCDILGYARDDLLGRSPDAFVSEEDRQRLQQQFKERRNQEQHSKDAYRGYEITWVKGDGSTVITSVSPRPIFDGDEFQGSFAVITDITEQKKMQRQRREAREFLENIFRTTNDGIVVSDTDGKIIRVNSTIEKLLGYDEQEMIGVSALGFFPQEAGYRRQGLEMAERLRSKGSVQNWETEWCRKDGSRVPVEINVTFLHDRDGTETGAVAAVRDITERHAIEQHLLQAEKLKSLGEMASGVAHDFNNMLTAILGRAQLLKRMLGNALPQADAVKVGEIEKGLDVIEDAALDGAETVRRIQDFSRADMTERFTEAVDLTEVIRGALEYTRTRWKDDAELKGLHYSIKDTLTAPMTVVGNAPELREVFTNLINNSLDAMPHGGTLSFSAECDTQTATIKVQDTGTGIARALIERIFDPFFTTKGPQSSGLGMSVSYGIIRRHNGSISVSSDEGEGTTMTISLPLGRAELRPQPEIEPAPQGASLHVLVIDDDEDVREVLEDMLTSTGHTVESATDGQTGLEIFRATPFDLVFTDLGMPGLSGWDVAREVKSIREHTLLALVTGWDVQFQKENIEKYKVDYILNKPFQVSHILDLVSMAQKRLNGKL